MTTPAPGTSEPPLADRVGDALSREVERRTAELAKGLAGWRDHAEQFQREINWLRGELALHRAKAHGYYWAWLGDGTDHPESLTCPVVISANDLRKILVGERERAGKINVATTDDEVAAALATPAVKGAVEQIDCAAPGDEAAREATFIINVWKQRHPNVYFTTPEFEDLRDMIVGSCPRFPRPADSTSTFPMTREQLAAQLQVERADRANFWTMIEEREKLLREMEWDERATPLVGRCRVCEGTKRMGHAPGCRLAFVLGKEKDS